MTVKESLENAAPKVVLLYLVIFDIWLSRSILIYVRDAKPNDLPIQVVTQYSYDAWLFTTLITLKACILFMVAHVAWSYCYAYLNEPPRRAVDRDA